MENLQSQKRFVDAAADLVKLGLEYDYTENWQESGQLDPDVKLARVARTLQSSFGKDIGRAAGLTSKPTHEVKHTHIHVHEQRLSWMDWWFLSSLNRGDRVTINNYNGPSGSSHASSRGSTSGGSKKGDDDAKAMGVVAAVIFVAVSLGAIAASGVIGVRMWTGALSDRKLKGELDESAAKLREISKIFDGNQPPTEEFERQVWQLLSSYDCSLNETRVLIGQNVRSKFVGGCGAISLFSAGMVGLYAGLQQNWTAGRLAIFGAAPTGFLFAISWGLKPSSSDVEHAMRAEQRRHSGRHEDMLFCSDNVERTRFGVVWNNVQALDGQVQDRINTEKAMSACASAPPPFNPEVMGQYPGLGGQCYQQPLYPHFGPFEIQSCWAPPQPHGWW